MVSGRTNCLVSTEKLCGGGGSCVGEGVPLSEGIVWSSTMTFLIPCLKIAIHSLLSCAAQRLAWSVGRRKSSAPLRNISTCMCVSISLLLEYLDTPLEYYIYIYIYNIYIYIAACLLTETHFMLFNFVCRRERRQRMECSR